MLVMICLLTTPTRAYEAYKNSPFANYKQQERITEIKAEQLSALDVCAEVAKIAEADYGIKPELLQTIASVESGRWVKSAGKRIAWPWTIQAEGKGHYYKNKAEAVAAVKSLQARGINNIDVGCMQINLKYHGEAFKNIEEALEPANNVAYSAKFLKKLYKKNGNWQKTAMQYHSKNHGKGMIYKSRLEKHYAEYINPESNMTLF